MFSEEERNIFIEYSLQNEDNLKISINSALSFRHLRERIIRDFIELIEKSLRKELDELIDDWTIDNSIKDNIFEHWNGVFLSKKTWNQDYQIGFSSEKHDAKGFIIGVAKNEKVPHIDGLLEKLNNEYRQGSQSNSWNWYQWMDQPYRDWDNEEILIMMYNDEATDYFTKHIMTIVRIASDIIDSQIKTNSANIKAINSDS